MLSIITLMQAGLPLASARSIARRRSAARVDMLAVAAERRHHLVVARRQKLAAVHAVGAVVAALDLALGVPARVVAEHGDERQAAPHRGLELGDVEADGAVAQHGEHRRLRLDHPRRERKRQRAADRAGDAVDQAAADRKHALAPLREFAAVADQHGVGIALDEGAQRAEHFGRMQAARRLRDDAAPCGRPVVERGARFGEPAGVRGALSAARASSVSRGAALRRRRSRAAAARPFPSRRARPAPASGSIAITRTSGSNAGPVAHLVVKSSALPSSTIRSARLIEIGEGAERGVGDAARAFHDDGGRAGRGFELCEQRAAAARSTAAGRR